MRLTIKFRLWLSTLLNRLARFIYPDDWERERLSKKIMNIRPELVAMAVSPVKKDGYDPPVDGRLRVIYEDTIFQIKRNK